MKTLMIRLTTLFAVIMLSGWTAGLNNALGEELTTLQWKKFSLRFPKGWEKEVETDDNGRHMLKFRCTKTKLPIEMIITVVPDVPPPDTDTYYQQTPSLIALSFSYSYIKALVGEAEANRAIVSFGQVQLGNGPAASTHIAAWLEDGRGTAAMQSFVLVRNNMMLTGGLVTIAPRGQLIEDPVYHAAIREAYDIMRSMQIQ